MTLGFSLSSLTGLLVVLCIAFSAVDLDFIVFASADLSPSMVVELFYRSTGSKPLAATMSAVLILLLIGCSISVVATSARHIVNIAKDEGLPLSHIWRQSTTIGGSKDPTPVNACALSLGFTVILGTVHMIYSASLLCSISIFVSCMFSGYLITIISVLGRRILATELPPSCWSLGIVSGPVNTVALLYTLLSLGFSFVPLTSTDLSFTTFNWSSVIWLSAVVTATSVYVLHGCYVFKGPGLTTNRSFDDLPDPGSTNASYQ